MTDWNDIIILFLTPSPWLNGNIKLVPIQLNNTEVYQEDGALPKSDKKLTMLHSNCQSLIKKRKTDNAILQLL